MQTDYGDTEIRSLVNQVRRYHSGIGEYTGYSINSAFDYLAKLSNGKLKVTKDELQAHRDGRLTPAMIAVIARRFHEKGQAEPDPLPDAVHHQQQHRNQQHQAFSDAPGRVAAPSAKLIAVLVAVLMILGIAGAVVFFVMAS